MEVFVTNNDFKGLYLIFFKIFKYLFVFRKIIITLEQLIYNSKQYNLMLTFSDR